MDDIFDTIAVKWMDAACLPQASEVPETLYHYTDAAGLVGMLQNSTIWATDSRFLNDKSEIEHTRQLVRNITKQRHSHTKDPFLLEFYSRLERFQKIEAPDDSFVFSLSKEPDDLSQWRGYARDGQGFTIGFSGPDLRTAGFGSPPEYNFFPVEYDHEKQEIEAQNALKEFEEALKKRMKLEGADLGQVCNLAAQNFDWFVETSALVNKHRSFNMENEWRITKFVTPSQKASLIKVRASGLRLVNYIELRPRGEDPERLPLTKIGIGPGFSDPGVVHAVRAICRSNGYDPHIYFADTPFRRV